MQALGGIVPSGACHGITIGQSPCLLPSSLLTMVEDNAINSTALQEDVLPLLADAATAVEMKRAGTSSSRVPAS
jgi:hypothetical protein